VGVIAVRPEGQTLDWAVDRAPRQPSTIVSHDRIMIHEFVTEGLGGVGVTVATRQDQERRTRSAHAVEERCASYVERIILVQKGFSTNLP
jgi:hypothetical protein